MPENGCGKAAPQLTVYAHVVVMVGLTAQAFHTDDSMR